MDNNFRYDKNVGKFSKRVQNAVGRGEIACYKQLLLTIISEMTKVFESFRKGLKMLWEEEKLLVTSISPLPKRFQKTCTVDI